MAYKLDQEQTELYKDYSLDNDYSFVSGKVVLPVAVDPDSDENPVDVVQIFAPYRMRTVKYAARKEGTPPVVPAPESVGAFTFLGGEVEVPAPVPSNNHQFTWAVGGEYVFVCSVATDSGLILGNRPMIFEQQAFLPQGQATEDVPEDVQQAGRGVLTGYALGEQIDLTNRTYRYPEISYFPAVFFSEDLITGPANYPDFL